MGEFGTGPGGALSAQPPGIGTTPFRPNRALQFVPFVGVVAFLAVRNVYPLLDDAAFNWIGLGLFFAAMILISFVQRKVKAGEEVESFFPLTIWLAFGPLIVAAILLVNGAVDRAPVQSHQESVTAKTARRGRSTIYYLEVTSWRTNRPTEQIKVSRETYAQFQMNDPVVIEVHRGALAIPWIGGIRSPSP